MAMPAVIVLPEREMPGMVATACAADQRRIADAHRALVAAARNNAVGNIEQTAVEQERRADEASLII